VFFEALLYLSPWEAQAVYALAWLSFGLGHSILAGDGAKRRLFGALGPWYRLSYNLFATLHIAVIWGLGAVVLGPLPAFPFGPVISGALAVVAVSGVVILVVALREYDLGLFSGLAQIRNHRAGREGPDEEALVTTGLHRFVRHPLYLGAHLILWGRAVDPFGLATALWGSCYLLIGAGFEEKRLARLYGAAYEDYRDRVPSLVPWPRRRGS